MLATEPIRGSYYKLMFLREQFSFCLLTFDRA